jgi:mono/diheme cytochrome c family protein
MPPSGVAAAADVAVLSKWIAAGMPGGTCGGGTNVFAGGSVCTSGRTHVGDENYDMRPGEACNACHTRERKKTFAFAGTVYPTGHEPNDCVGITDNSVRVIVTDGDGKDTVVPMRASGNFALDRATLKAPVHVRVESADGSKKRAMGAALNLPGDGDCNGCHTEAGTNKAPGRVVAPL